MRMTLLTKKIRRRLPPLGATDAQGLDALAQVKFFYPDFSWTWYGVEFDGNNLFWGLVYGFEKELGTFSLSELQENRGKLGMPIERDRFFKPVPLKTLLND